MLSNNLFACFDVETMTLLLKNKDIHSHFESKISNERAKAIFSFLAKESQKHSSTGSAHQDFFDIKNVVLTLNETLEALDLWSADLNSTSITEGEKYKIRSELNKIEGQAMILIDKLEDITRRPTLPSYLQPISNLVTNAPLVNKDPDQIFAERVVNSEAVLKNIENRSHLYKTALMNVLDRYFKGEIRETTKSGISNKYKFLGFTFKGDSQRLCFEITSEIIPGSNASSLNNRIKIVKVGPHENFYVEFHRK